MIKVGMAHMLIGYFSEVCCPIKCCPYFTVVCWLDSKVVIKWLVELWNTDDSVLFVLM